FDSKLFIATMLQVIMICTLIEYGWRSLQFAIENYIINRIKVAPVHSHRESQKTVIPEVLDDSECQERGFSVKINQNSINNKEIEVDSKNASAIETPSTQDQLVIK